MQEQRLIDANEVLGQLYCKLAGTIAIPQRSMLFGIIKKIEDAPTIESPRWTPCAEGMPKPRHKGQQRQAYLVSLETGCVSMMFYEFNPNGYLGEGWTDKIIGVIAWRELPEPYNPDRKEDAKSDVVSKWPDWKKRAALSNYELGKED